MEQHDGHRRRLTTLIDLQPVVDGDTSGAPGVLRRLCSAATVALSAPWAGISLVEDGQTGGALTGSSVGARALEDLQFELGEGPCVDSVRGRQPVLEADLGGSGFARWPAYAPAAYGRGVRGVFAFPMQFGAACVGALGIYQDHSEPMPAESVGFALTFADIARDVLLEAQAGARDGEVEGGMSDALRPRLEVYQAQGMVMVDLGVTLPEAMAVLRAHAFTLGRPLAEVAREIVAGTMRLEP